MIGFYLFSMKVGLLVHLRSWQLDCLLASKYIIDMVHDSYTLPDVTYNDQYDDPRAEVLGTIETLNCWTNSFSG